MFRSPHTVADGIRQLVQYDFGAFSIQCLQTQQGNALVVCPHMNESQADKDDPLYLLNGARIITAALLKSLQSMPT
jgi:hypothetical protein